MQPMRDRCAWIQGARSAGLVRLAAAKQMADSLTESDAFDSFWYGRSCAQEARQTQGWVSFGMEAGVHGVSEGDAANLLDVLAVPNDAQDGFWAGWRTQTA